jgi:hypothetical membrane protein
MITPLQRRAAIGAMIAALVYQATLLVLVVLRPDLDPAWHTISEWAIGPYGWIMSAAFLLSAASYGLLFLALRRHMTGAAGRTGLALLALCVLGTVGVGIFTTDPLGTPPEAMTTTGVLHVVLGSGALLLLPFAAMFLNTGLARDPRWSAARRSLLATAWLPLLGLLGVVAYLAIFVAPLEIDHGPGVNIGIPPRILLLTYALWLLVLSRQVVRMSQTPASQPPS